MISEHAVLADGLDGFLLAVDVVPAGLLKVPAVIRHKLHLHTVLKKNGQQCKTRSLAYLFFVVVVWHDVYVGDVDPVVILAVNLTAVLCLIGVSPGQDGHSSHSCIFYLQNTSWSKSHLNSVSSLEMISSLARLVRSFPPVQ